MPRWTLSLAERYENKIDRSGGESACHPWTGNTVADGYGMISVDSGNRLAHRIGWALLNGEIPNGLFVCHTCDNPPCQNPRHWFLGTPGENSDDRERKGRGHRTRGEASPNARLTEAQVIEIRRLQENGGTLRNLAEQFNVGRMTISKIVHRETWSHL
jgi:hypothetical protein